RRLVREEEQRRVGDLLGLAGAAQRHGAVGALLHQLLGIHAARRLLIGPGDPCGGSGLRSFSLSASSSRRSPRMHNRPPREPFGSAFSPATLPQVLRPCATFWSTAFATLVIERGNPSSWWSDTQTEGWSGLPSWRGNRSSFKSTSSRHRQHRQRLPPSRPRENIRTSTRAA